jgi:hypothetical protein
MASYNEESYRRAYVPRDPAPDAIEAEIILIEDHPPMGRPYNHPTGGIYGGDGAVANVHHDDASPDLHAGGGKDGRASADMCGSNTPEIAALAKTKSSVLLQDQILDLKEEGFPSGLAEEMGKTRAFYPVRFWVLDNSGSMMSNDGQSIRGSISVQCTRWAVSSLSSQDVFSESASCSKICSLLFRNCKKQ